jgi:alkylation response protein AidB-like acyl-CoA dehydrogenase
LLLRGLLYLLEEIASRGSPRYNAVGVKMLAPTLFKYGTEGQKEKHLELIAKGEEFWCEGFTGPNAGSDLASLQTKAGKDNNDYIINGQKTWSTFANYSGWCCLLARTDLELKRHRGISFFLVDLSMSGVTVRPIIDIQGEPDFGARRFHRKIRDNSQLAPSSLFFRRNSLLPEARCAFWPESKNRP